jgi:hypothetical protein
MEAVLNNPYRQVGLLVGATAREQSRQITRLKAFLQAEQEPQEDSSFPALGNINRTIQTVDQAASRLNLDQDRMHAALFWFWNGRPVTDEAAFDAIKDGDTASAYAIWEKLTTETDENGKKKWKPITEKNASAFHNLATLILGSYPNELSRATVAKLTFIESEYFDKLVSANTDTTYKASKHDLEIWLIKEILGIIDNKKQIELFQEVSHSQFAAKLDFPKLIIEGPIGNVEQHIEIAKTGRKNNKAHAAEAGKKLYEQTKNDLQLIQSILGSSDLKYTSLVDKVANEILQCSIDYYNDSQEKELHTDYAVVAMELAKQADSLAIGNLTKDRIKESIATLEDMQDREIATALQVLRNVKRAYDDNDTEITRKVRLQERTDPDIIMGRSTINWSKVRKVIDESIDWDKVVEVVLQTIPPRNIDKIKSSKNPAKITEYKELVIFVLGKLNTTNHRKLKYLHYWESTGGATKPLPANPKPGSSGAKASEIIPWIIGIIVSILCYRYELGWWSILIVLMAFGLTQSILESIEKNK